MDSARFSHRDGEEHRASKNVLRDMTDKTVAIGIVGAGIWGSNHALALTTHPRARWRSSAIGTRIARGAPASGSAARGRRASTSVAASDVEAVTIATPDHLHREPVVAMLRAGKHVLVEKPLATTVADGARDG